MRTLSLLAATAVIGSLTCVTPAAAFGDKCYAPLKEEGEGSTLREAMREAKDCWQAEARKRHGAAAASWNYSGDRRMDCSWNATGTKFRCVASALPCSRL